MIDVMDTKIDPCNDFYEYACGGWLKSVPVPESRTRYSRFDELSEQNSEVLKQILNKIIANESKPEVRIKIQNYRNQFLRIIKEIL